VIATEPLENTELAEFLARLAPGDTLAFTSARAVQCLNGIAPVDGVTIAAVGPATAEALEGTGWIPQVVGQGGARDLAHALDLKAGSRVLFPCAENARTDLEEELGKRGIEVERLPVYRTVPETDVVLDSTVAYRLYASPSAVEACTLWEREHEDLPTVRIPLGQATRAALEQARLSAIDGAIAGPEDALRRLILSIKGGK
jgi:uroporphyrinogen-III synthase